MRQKQGNLESTWRVQTSSKTEQFLQRYPEDSQSCLKDYSGYLRPKSIFTWPKVCLLSTKFNGNLFIIFLSCWQQRCKMEKTFPPFRIQSELNLLLYKLHLKRMSALADRNQAGVNLYWSRTTYRSVLRSIHIFRDSLHPQQLNTLHRRDHNHWSLTHASPLSAHTHFSRTRLISCCLYPQSCCDIKGEAHHWMNCPGKQLTAIFVVFSLHLVI